MQIGKCLYITVINIVLQLLPKKNYIITYTTINSGNNHNDTLSKKKPVNLLTIKKCRPR